MRTTDCCASFLVGSPCEVAMRSAYVTSPATAPGEGGSEWHPVQFAASIVATLLGTHVPPDMPPSAAVEPPLLELPLELPPELVDDPTDVVPDELPLDPEDGTMLEPELEDVGDPCTTITFSGGAEEHALTTTTTHAPSRVVLMAG
jgi:hypothetical protein